MGKKKRQPNPCATVTDETSEQIEGINCENAADASATPKCSCQHIAKAVNQKSVCKNFKTADVGKFVCNSCPKKDGVIPPSSERWICLQCGHRQCTKEHSLQHFCTPRTELHCLALNVNESQVWCHSCKMYIPDDASKKLRTFLPQIKKMMDQTQRTPSVDPSSSDDMPPPLLEMDEKGGGGSIQLPPAMPTPLVTPANGLNNNKIVLKPRRSAVRGLVNLGNTCFFNSVLQCLARTPTLVDTLRLLESDEQEIYVPLENGESLKGHLEKSNDALGPSLSEVLETLSVGGPAVNPIKLLTVLRKRCPQFEGYDQHDAHELLRHLLDNVRLADHKRYQALMLTKMGLTKKVNPSSVPQDLQKKLKALDIEVVEKVTLVPDSVFKGKLISTLECQDCRSRSHRVESFLDLSLPIVVDKPQPPCIARRKTSPEPEEEDSSKRRIRWLGKVGSGYKKRVRSHWDPPAAAVSPGRGESDADVEDNEDNERGRLESGYSSEKADEEEPDARPSGSSDDSARASPAATISQNTVYRNLQNHLESKPDLDFNAGGSEDYYVCAGAPPVSASSVMLAMDQRSSLVTEISDARDKYNWRRDERRTRSRGELILGRPGQARAEFELRDPSTVTKDDPMYLLLPRSGYPPTGYGPAGDASNTSPPSIEERTGHLDNSISQNSYIESSIAKVMERIMPSAQEVSERLESLSLNSPDPPTVNGDNSIEESKTEIAIADSTDPGSLESAPVLKSQVELTVPVIELPNEACSDTNVNSQTATADVCLVESTCEPPPEPLVEYSCKPLAENGTDTSPPRVKIEEVSDENWDPNPSCMQLMTNMDIITNNTENKASERTRVRGSRADDVREGECSVQSCLSQFISRELLTGANRVGCTTCTKSRGNKDGKMVCTDASKQFLIKEAPQVLILHLKRFQVQMYSFRKLSKHVAFPLILDLAPFCEPELQKAEEGNLKYSLYGVVEHSGTMNGGHYVAHIKVENEDDDDDNINQRSRWYCISDSHVTEVTEQRVLTSQAYLLFYKRFSQHFPSV